MSFFKKDVHIHIHVHNESGDIAGINQKLNNIMATLEQFEEALGRIDTATTNIAAQITDLKNQIANAGLPADVEDSVLTRLTSIATQLESMGKTPENPVPGADEETPTT